MENLETQESLLNLGKKLIENFKSTKGDQICEWMAHYVAEKISAIDSTKGKRKLSAQRECFETILVLWKYQAYFPHRIRPFDNFDAVFRALENIDPEKSSPLFFRTEDAEQNIPIEIKDYIETIVNLDAATRTMISFFVKEAMLSAVDESTIQWLDAIKGIDKPNEARVIFNIISELDTEAEVMDEVMANKEQRKKELSKQIERLNAFENISQKIKCILKNQLEDLES